MSRLVVVEKPIETVSSWTTLVKSFTAAAVKALSEISEMHPIQTDNEGHIHFHPSKMLRGQYYPFQFKDKEYLLRKTEDKVIDIFEIKEK